jgi:hypothetical protein
MANPQHPADHTHSRPTRSDDAPIPIYPGMATTLTEHARRDRTSSRDHGRLFAAAKPQRSWICLLQFALFLQNEFLHESRRFQIAIWLGSPVSIWHCFDTASPSPRHLERSRFAERPPSVDKYAPSGYILSRHPTRVWTAGLLLSPGPYPRAPADTAAPTNSTPSPKNPCHLADHILCLPVFGIAWRVDAPRE